MSNALAIAAVTTTLRKLLQTAIDPEAGAPQVETLSPDKVNDLVQIDETGRLNLFLYHTQINPAWRNRDMPRQTKPNETGFPPLALDLYYLVSAYVKNEKDNLHLGHRLLGRAMLALHDHPVPSRDEIRAAGVESELADQIERVRITPQPLSPEELSKLWMMFQTSYRISAAYLVSVVLIESNRAARTPLPVLKRGPEGRGATAQSDLVPPFPAIDDLQRLNSVTSALESMKNRVSFDLGDSFALLGHHFGLAEGDMTKVTVTVRMDSARLAQPQDLVPAGAASDHQIIVQIPNDAVNFPAGFYTVSVLVMPNGKPEETRVTNEWPLLVAPQITAALPLTVARQNIVNGLGTATIDLTCAPEVRPGQRVALALGDREVRADPHPVQTSALRFVAANLGAATFRVRLRVDGVDSHLIDFTDPEKPAFLDSQKITIT